MTTWLTRSKRAAWLDRIVGYKVSPLLWGQSAARSVSRRVQTVAVRLVVEREREIQAFVKTEYWGIVANLSAQLPPAFDARLYKIADKTVKSAGSIKASRRTKSTSKTKPRPRASSPSWKARVTSSPT